MAGTLVVWALTAAGASAAVLAIHEFNTNDQNWEAAGDMAAVAHSAFSGGSLRGDFNSQGMIFTPETGSFHQDTDPNFLGVYPGPFLITGFSFDLYADSVIPLDVNLRLLSGVNAYFITLNISGRNWTGWENFTVALDDPLWQGNPAILNTVTAVEVQVARGSAAAQSFYLDNFQTLSDEFIPGALVPEPNTLMMFLNAGLLLAVLRRRAMRKRPASEEAV
ncbi:MAG TPA: PEP-CTERM sorting domain-containing protein [Kiritimatiellia bacterium]|nr:PEP-CTERM sorting domain-containing protein [Kiritimatiellia bacterium]